MKNYGIIFSFILLFCITELDAQRRSTRKSGTEDDKKEQGSDKKADNLFKQYDFNSKDALVEHLLVQKLTRTEQRTVENYRDDKELQSREITRLNNLQKKYPTRQTLGHLIPQEVQLL